MHDLILQIRRIMEILWITCAQKQAELDIADTDLAVLEKNGVVMITQDRRRLQHPA